MSIASNSSSNLQEVVSETDVASVKSVNHNPRKLSPIASETSIPVKSPDSQKRGGIKNEIITKSETTNQASMNTNNAAQTQKGSKSEPFSSNSFDGNPQSGNNIQLSSKSSNPSLYTKSPNQPRRDHHFVTQTPLTPSSSGQRENKPTCKQMWAGVDFKKLCFVFFSHRNGVFWNASVRNDYMI